MSVWCSDGDREILRSQYLQREKEKELEDKEGRWKLRVASHSSLSLKGKISIVSYNYMKEESNNRIMPSLIS